MSPIAFLVLIAAASLFQNVRCAQLRLHSDQEEQQLYKISACVANCLATSQLKDACYEHCSEPGALDPIVFKYPRKAFEVELICRDSTTLMVQIRQQLNGSARIQNDSDVNIYVVKLLEAEQTLNSGAIFYVSNTSLVKIENLVPTKLFIVSATVLSSNSEYMTAGKRSLETLPLDYQPGEITETNVISTQANADNPSLLDVIISWKPAADRSCHYEVLCYANQSPDYQLQQVYVDQTTSLYHHTIDSLELNAEYEIAVRATNPRYPALQSELHWYTFNSPSCIDWYNSGEFCDPETVNNIQVLPTIISDNLYRFNISWDQPRFAPDYYLVKLFDLDLTINEDDSANAAERNVSGHLTHVLIDSFPIRGPQYEVLITAHTNNRSSPAQSIIKPLHAGQVAALATWHNHWLLAIVITVILSVCSIGHVTLRKLRTKEASQDLEANYEIKLENIELDDVETLPMPSIDDPMEIEFDRVELLEVLGEGAFGLVRKGTLGGTEVAVKMLKEHATLQSVQEFRREIEVMKSVGPHPNVVGIVGHFTQRPNEMMLLTEYCSEGNLLNYLRDEWHKVMRRKESKVVPEYLDCRTPGLAGSKRPESVFNFDTSFVNEKRSLEYKNICTEPIENRLYPLLSEEVNNNINELNSVDNQCYHSSECEKSTISSVELLEFAKQIATGMDFLARNKVVHRDLAARNVLIGSNRVVKISDFGLSRDIYQDNLYRKTGSGKLPIKWLALESLTHQMYTSQSDVWSFGVLLYEICTLGGNPYPHLAAGNLIAELRRGYRMEKPAGCSQELYELMRSCWSSMPIDRPNFSAIQDRLGELTRASAQGLVELIDLEAIGQGVQGMDVVDGAEGYLKPVA